MAKSKLVQANEKIAEAAVNGYKWLQPKITFSQKL